MAQSETHRNRWALGLASTFTILIFISFAFYRGFLSFGNPNNAKNQVASVVSAEKIPSPLQNTKQTFSSAFSEIDKQYQNFKNSLESVLVPFVTGIEVYERK